MPLSVVMVSANFQPYIGGAEKQALEVAKELVRRGARVRVATRALRGLAQSEVHDGVEILRLCACGPGLIGTVTFLVSLFAFLFRRRRDYDAVHVNLLSSPAVAAALAGRLGRRLVAVKLGGGVGFGELALSSRSLLGRLKLAAVRALRPTLVAVNAGQIEELSACGLGHLPRRLIPNGVDLNLYAPAPVEARVKLRASLGWNGLACLFVGRLARDKRQVEVARCFLEGWSRARREGFSGSFYLAGSGPAQADFNRLIQELHVAESVRLLGSRRDVASLYQAADVFILPTISEGLSNALLEAMASGLPVLASRVPGTREAVEEGRQGLLFEPSDPDEVKRHLLAIHRDPGHLAALGAAARERAVKSYSLGTAVDRWLELYGAASGA